MAEPRVLLTGVAMGESPRWYDERLWFCDWAAGEVIAVDLSGASEVVARVADAPFCIDFGPDGQLSVVSGRAGKVLRREPDGTLAIRAELTGVSAKPWNEILVDGRGNT